MSTCAAAIFLIRIHLSRQDATELWTSLKTSTIFVSNPNQGQTMDTMQVENPPALNQSLNQDQHASSVRPKLSLSSPPSQLDSFSKNHGCSWVFSTTVHPRRSSEKSIQPSQPSWHFGGIDDADSALPCPIQEPQDNIPKVPRSTSSMSYVGEVRVLGVAHLLWALLLVLADIVSDRHVGEKHEVDDGRQRNWQAVTGFSLPPGILTSVGIFLLASSLLSMVCVKKSSKVLHISAMVPSVFAAVSVGIGLYVCSVSVANEDNAKYDLLVKEYQHNGQFNTPFPMGLAIFGALILLVTTSATSVFFTMKIARAHSSPRNTLTQNSFKYTQFFKYLTFVKCETFPANISYRGEDIYIFLLDPTNGYVMFS